MYVRLYAPEFSDSLFPKEGLLSNNSEVDLCDFDKGNNGRHFDLHKKESSCIDDTNIEQPTGTVELSSTRASTTGTRVIESQSLHRQRGYSTVRDVPYTECVLGPGEQLFIPRWHWHFVASIDENSALRWRDCRHPIADADINTKADNLRDNNDGNNNDSNNNDSNKNDSNYNYSNNDDGNDNDDDSNNNDSNINTSQNSTIDENNQFSFSVSFWWGRRILKQDSG